MANMLLLSITTAVLVAAYQVSAFGAGPCGCYQLVLHTLKECNKKSLFTFTSPKLTLNADCTLVSEGCLSYGPFSASNIVVNITNQVSTLTGIGRIDGCRSMTYIPREYKRVMKYFNIDTACPVRQPKKICAKAPVTNLNLAALPFYLQALDFASKLGVLNVTMRAKHSFTSSSCVRFAAEIKKNPTCGPVSYPVYGMLNLPSIPGITTVGLPTLSTIGLPTLSTSGLPTLSTIGLPTLSTSVLPTVSTTGMPYISTIDTTSMSVPTVTVPTCV